MQNIQTFQMKSRYLKFKFFVTMNILLVVLFYFFYCDNFINIHATLLFIFITIVMVVTV